MNNASFHSNASSRLRARSSFTGAENQGLVAGHLMPKPSPRKMTKAKDLQDSPPQHTPVD